ncbi:MAG: dihydrolipoyl dehydrogenase [Elusimicrobiales bacterium]|nr:dihydrolipoyl dehydrogenase [Elusimicrobiales bacterium]
MSRTIKTDVAVIGAGTAGLFARHYAETSGAKAVAFDPGPLGTTCARVGCMPSKLLIAAAEAAHSAAHAKIFGVKTTVKVDGAKVMSRVRKWRDTFVGGMMEEYGELIQKKLLVKTKARFTGPHTLEAGDKIYRFKAAVVATGSAPVVPPPYRACPGFLLTREEIFEQRRLPGSLLVVGAGLIGLELGQALSRLGVRVTVLGLDRLVGPLSDEGLREEAIKCFSGEFDFHPHHELLSVKPAGKKIRVSFRDSRGKKRAHSYDRVLIAAGQRPDFDGLGLENTGVPLNAKGAPEADPETMRAGRSNIFLAGDADPYRPSLHEAGFEGRLAGANAARFPRVERKERGCALTIAFTDPQMAVIGTVPPELKKGSFCRGELDFSQQGRALMMNAGRGRLNLYGDRKNGRLLGAEMLGPRAEHLAHLIAWAIEKKMTVGEMLRMPFYHPVFEEGLKRALEDLKAGVKGRRAGCEEGRPGDRQS